MVDLSFYYANLQSLAWLFGDLGVSNLEYAYLGFILNDRITKEAQFDDSFKTDRAILHVSYFRISSYYSITLLLWLYSMD